MIRNEELERELRKFTGKHKSLSPKFTNSLLPLDNRSKFYREKLELV